MISDQTLKMMYSNQSIIISQPVKLWRTQTSNVTSNIKDDVLKPEYHYFSASKITEDTDL